MQAKILRYSSHVSSNREADMPGAACFSYSSGASLGMGNGDLEQRAPRGLPGRAGTGGAYFAFTAEVPSGAGSRNATQWALRDLQRIPYTRFSYSSDARLGSRLVTPGGTGSHCFRY
jgi:hypothetical protein